MIARDRLAKLLDQLSQEGRASTGDCLRLFSLARELLEESEHAADYQQLVFYADWSLHARLDRRSAKRIREGIQHLIDKDAAGERVDFPFEISRLLSLSELYREFRKLLQLHELPTFLVDSHENWERLVRQLLTDLRGKPLIGRAWTSEELRTGWGWRARSLRLETARDSDNLEWVVEIGPRITMRGALLAT